MAEKESIDKTRHLLDRLKALEETLQDFRRPGRPAEPARARPQMPRSRLVRPPGPQAALSRSSETLRAWGWFPAMTLVCACMLGLVSLGDALSRSGHRHGGFPF